MRAGNLRHAEGSERSDLAGGARAAPPVRGLAALVRDASPGCARLSNVRPLPPGRRIPALRRGRPTPPLHPMWSRPGAPAHVRSPFPAPPALRGRRRGLRALRSGGGREGQEERQGQGRARRGRAREAVHGLEEGHQGRREEERLPDAVAQARRALRRTGQGRLREAVPLRDQPVTRHRLQLRARRPAERGPPAPVGAAWRPRDAGAAQSLVPAQPGPADRPRARPVDSQLDPRQLQDRERARLVQGRAGGSRLARRVRCPRHGGAAEELIQQRVGALRQGSLRARQRQDLPRQHRDRGDAHLLAERPFQARPRGRARRPLHRHRHALLVLASPGRADAAALGRQPRRLLPRGLQGLRARRQGELLAPLRESLASREEGPRRRGERTGQADRVLHRQDRAREVPPVDQGGHREVADRVRGGGLQERHHRQGRAHRRSRLGCRGRALQHHPLDHLDAARLRRHRALACGPAHR